MSKVLMVMIAVFAFSSQSLANRECFSKTYSKSHMKAHKGQSLSSMTVIMSSGGSMMVKGTSAQGSLEYSVYLDSYKENISCAKFMADGDQDKGCVSIIRRSDGAISVSPVTMPYNDGVDDIYAIGLELHRCEGAASDGDGCLGTYKTLTMLPSNREDNGYLLKQVACKL